MAAVGYASQTGCGYQSGQQGGGYGGGGGYAVVGGSGGDQQQTGGKMTPRLSTFRV